MPRSIHGNITNIPLFAQESASGQTLWPKYLQALLVTPPLMHVQNFFSIAVLRLMIRYVLVGEERLGDFVKHLHGATRNQDVGNFNACFEETRLAINTCVFTCSLSSFVLDLARPF
jgi:hypothetical protein